MYYFFGTLESLTVLIGISVIGFYVLSRKILTEDALKFLTTLAINIALPSLVFVNIVQNFNPQNFPKWWSLPLWWIGFTLLAGIISIVCTPLSKNAIRREFALCLFYQNAVFVPLPIIVSLFGEDSIQTTALLIFAVFYPSFVFTTYPLFFHKRSIEFNKTKVFNPVLVATLAAISLKLMGIGSYVPGFVTKALNMVGNMTIPLVLMILGGSIYLDYKQKEKIQIQQIIKFVLIKNILFPIIALFVVSIVHPRYEVALLVVLQASVPPMTAAPILIEKMNGNKSIANQFLLGSFLFSLITIPIVFYIFECCIQIQKP